MHVEAGQIRPGAAAGVLVFDARGRPGARGPGGVLAAAGLNARLLVGRQDEFVVLQATALPLAGVEVEDPPGLDREVRIAREDPTAMLPRADGIVTQPPPHGGVTDLRHEPTALGLPRDISRAQAR